MERFLRICLLEYNLRSIEAVSRVDHHNVLSLLALIEEVEPVVKGSLQP